MFRWAANHRQGHETYQKKKEVKHYSGYHNLINKLINWGPRWRSWLRHCGTNRRVAGSIPDGVIGFFH
jgi:hypothetical protein